MLVFNLHLATTQHSEIALIVPQIILILFGSDFITDSYNFWFKQQTSIAKQVGSLIMNLCS